MTSMKVSCASVSCGFSATNIFDFKVLASTFSSGFSPTIIFQTLSRCSSSELPHYTMNCTNVTIYDGLMRLVLYHGMSYNLTIILDQINSGNNGGVVVDFSDSLFSFAIINSSMYGSYYGLGLYYTPVPVCHFPIAQSLSSITIENSHFFDNFNAALVISAGGIMKVQHIIVSVKSCVIHDSFYYGLQIDATFMPFLTISISDTELTSNGGNLITNCYFVLLNNVTIANSLSTGLTLKESKVRVNNSLILRNNNGVSGGGIAITDKSYIAVLPQASFEFINNHATYKGGGIFSSSANLYPFQYANPHSHSKPIIYQLLSGITLLAHQQVMIFMVLLLMTHHLQFYSLTSTHTSDHQLIQLKCAFAILAILPVSTLHLCSILFFLGRK